MLPHPPIPAYFLLAPPSMTSIWAVSNTPTSTNCPSMAHIHARPLVHQYWIITVKSGSTGLTCYIGRRLMRMRVLMLRRRSQYQRWCPMALRFLQCRHIWSTRTWKRFCLITRCDQRQALSILAWLCPIRQTPCISIIPAILQDFDRRIRSIIATTIALRIGVLCSRNDRVIHIKWMAIVSAKKLSHHLISQHNIPSTWTGLWFYYQSRWRTSIRHDRHALWETPASVC